MSDTVLSRARAHASTTAALVDDLQRERDGLVQQRAELAVQIAEYDRLIAEMRPLAPTVAIDSADDHKKVVSRTQGVKRLVEATVRDLHKDRTWSNQELIIETVVARDVRVQGKSVVSSLSRLVDEGVLLREGKRGSFRYSLATIQPESTDEHNEPLLSPPELIVGKLKTVPEGCTKKELGWVVGDISNLDHALDKLIADGEIRVTGEGQAARYAIAERVAHTRPLFPESEATSS